MAEPLSDSDADDSAGESAPRAEEDEGEEDDGSSSLDSAAQALVAPGWRTWPRFERQALGSWDAHFALWVELLLKQQLDPELDALLVAEPQHEASAAYLSAVHRVEAWFGAQRDSLVGSSAWTADARAALETRPQLSSVRTAPTGDCEVCGRLNHPATHIIRLRGRPAWCSQLWCGEATASAAVSSALRSGADVVELAVGRFCHGRALAFHALAHFKYHARAIVQASARPLLQRGVAAEEIVARLLPPPPARSTLLEQLRERADGALSASQQWLAEGGGARDGGARGRRPASAAPRLFGPAAGASDDDDDLRDFIVHGRGSDSGGDSGSGGSSGGDEDSYFGPGGCEQGDGEDEAPPTDDEIWDAEVPPQSAGAADAEFAGAAAIVARAAGSDPATPASGPAADDSERRHLLPIREKGDDAVYGSRTAHDSDDDTAGSRQPLRPNRSPAAAPRQRHRVRAIVMDDDDDED